MDKVAQIPNTMASVVGIMNICNTRAYNRTTRSNNQPTSQPTTILPLTPTSAHTYRQTAVCTKDVCVCLLFDWAGSYKWDCEAKKPAPSELRTKKEHEKIEFEKKIVHDHVFTLKICIPSSDETICDCLCAKFTANNANERNTLSTQNSVFLSIHMWNL